MLGSNSALPDPLLKYTTIKNFFWLFDECLNKGCFIVICTILVCEKGPHKIFGFRAPQSLNLALWRTESTKWQVCNIPLKSNCISHRFIYQLWNECSGTSEFSSGFASVSLGSSSVDHVTSPKHGKCCKYHTFSNKQLLVNACMKQAVTKDLTWKFIYVL